MKGRKKGYCYVLKQGNDSYSFYSMENALDFLHGSRTGFVTACKNGTTYKGFTITKIGESYHREAHKTRLWKIWSAMKERCYRAKHEHYKSYGGRGITVCDAWREDYKTFKKWALTNGYEDYLTLDRIDVNGNYEPSNCRWISMSEQHKNKRTNRVVEYKGKKYILADLAKEVGMGKTTLKYRLDKGMNVEEAVESPIQKRTRGYRPSH